MLGCLFFLLSFAAGALLGLFTGIGQLFHFGFGGVFTTCMFGAFRTGLALFHQGRRLGATFVLLTGDSRG